MPEKIHLMSRRFMPHTDDGGKNVLVGLDELCKKYITKETTMVELGCYHGISTSLFAHYAKTVHSIDQAQPPWRINQYENIIFHRGNFVKMLPKIAHLHPEGIDLVYIDGNHSYEKVCQDIEMTLPLIKNTGYISGHDYVDRKCIDVIKAVEDKIGVEPEIFPDSSWLIKMSDIK